MFVTKYQIYIFIACVGFGGVCGVFYGLFDLLRLFVKTKIINDALDVLLFITLAFCFAVFSHVLEFSNLRAYMLFGVFLGFLCYLKSFHILLAKSIKKFYNIIDKKIYKFKKAQNDRKQVKKNNRRINRRRSVVDADFAINNDLSVNIHKSAKRHS